MIKTRMLRAILNKSWKQYPTKQKLYDHLPPISKTIQVKRTRHVRHSWRSKDELKSDIFLWTSFERSSVGRPARTYLQHLSADTRCSLEDLSGAMDDRDGWGEGGCGKYVLAVCLDDDDETQLDKVIFRVEM